MIVSTFLKYNKNRLLILTGIFALLCFSPISAQSRLIVKLKPVTELSGQKWKTVSAGIAAGYNLEWRPLFQNSDKNISLSSDGFDRSRYFTVTVVDSFDIEKAVTAIEASGIAEWTEIDRKMELFEIPDDELFYYQWYHSNSGQQYYGIERYDGGENDSLRLKSGKSGADIKTVTARDKEGQRAKPLIVIIDTGLDTEHPDIAANLWSNPNEIPDNGVDDDHNGYTDDYHGWDFSGDTTQFFNITGDNDPTDQHGHGTHVAGIAGAVSDNQIGVAGVCSYVDVLGLKIFPNSFTSVGMQAVMYATDMGADVINMSWGNFYPSKALKDILEYANEHNVVLVAAIGNFGDSSAAYPAAYETTIAVGATDSEDHITYFSSYGSWMDLAAPGLDILSLRANGTDMYESQSEPLVRIIEDYYYLADGTSMSSPMVTGAVGEILSYSPGISPDSVLAILTSSADDILDPYGEGDNFPGKDVFSGWGRLNLADALDLVEGRLAKISTPRQMALVDGELDIYGTAFSGFGEDFRLYITPLENELEKILISEGDADILGEKLGRFDSWDNSGGYKLILEVGENIASREIYYTNEPLIEISSPLQGDTIQGVLSLRGTIVAPGYQGCRIEMYPVEKPSSRTTIINTTAFAIDSLIGSYTVSGMREGEYVLDVIMRAEDVEYTYGFSLFISNGFAQGFPVTGKGLLNYGPAVYDLDGNGRLEVVASGRHGLAAYNHIGGYVPGRWRGLSMEYADAPPAVYDINNDGYGEVAIIADGKLQLFRFDGYVMPGFPIDVPVDDGQNGLPAVYFADMDDDGFEEIIYVTMDGEIYAYRHDGSSYFASLKGFFAEAPDKMYEHVPFVFVEDFNSDGQKEMIVVMRDIVMIYNTHNGIEPDWIENSRIIELSGITGACMADFDGDSLLELGLVGRETENEQVYVVIAEPDGSFLPGFPKYLDRYNYLINYPAAGDINGDDLPDIVFAISSIDLAEIWAVSPDGSTISSISGGEDSWFASFPGTGGAAALFDVDADSLPDVVIRCGNFYPGRVNEAVYAFDRTGEIIDGWPRYTFTNSNQVVYRLHMPTVGCMGIGEDADYADLLLTADDSSVYAWKLPVEYEKMNIAWGEFMHDSRHSGILPPVNGRPSTSPPVSTNTETPVPAGFYLAQNYPNPFNASTRMKFRLMKSSPVTLDIFNILGQKIRSLVSQNMEAGEHVVTWNGRDNGGHDAASGIYFYRLRTDLGEISRKMIVVK